MTEGIPDTVKPRPWIRYWARVFDIYLFSIIIFISLGFIDELLSLGLFDHPALSNETVLGIAMLFLWVFIEATLLSSVGTTFGKWLFNISLIKKTGKEIAFGDALGRSFQVFGKGLGAGLPIVSLVTLIVAYRKLMENGETSWDRDGGYFVSHRPLGTGRIIGIVCVGIMMSAIIILGVVADDL